MPLLINKNDVIEVICKFKGHIVPENEVKRLQRNPEEELECFCERCGFSIIIRMDPDDHDYYFISDGE